MSHIRRTTVRDLRYRFWEVQDLLREGVEVQITKGKRVTVRLVPAKPAVPTRRPDFLARLNKLYHGKHMKGSGAKLVALERSRERTFLPTRAS